MATETSLVNIALGRAQIRARLNAIATDTSAEAKVARDCYDDIRDNLLRKYLWSFAKKRVELAEVAQAPAFAYDNAYGLPADYLRTISVHPADSEFAKIRYKIETVSVLGTDTLVLITNATQVFLKYVAKQESVALMDAMFRDVLAWDLAEHFALAIKESSSHAEYCTKQMRRSLAEARAANSIEDWPDDYPAGSWVNERFVEGDNWYGDIYS